MIKTEGATAVAVGGVLDCLCFCFIICFGLVWFGLFVLFCLFDCLQMSTQSVRREL